MINFKIEQIAIATDDVDGVMVELAKMDSSFAGCFLGGYDLTKWITDSVTTSGKVHGDYGNTEADLYFHYESGIEFEILDYKSGPNWHKSAGRSGTFMSHIGMHVDEMPENLPFEIIQDVRTVDHTNSKLLETGRRYHYRIYNTRGLFGFDLKLIMRIEKGDE